MTPPDPERLSRDLINNDIARAAFPPSPPTTTSRALVTVLSVVSFAALSAACLVPVILLFGLLWQGWVHRNIGQLLLGGLLLLICAPLARSLVRAKKR